MLTTGPPGESESNPFEPIALRGGVAIPEEGPGQIALVNSADAIKQHQYHGQGLGPRTQEMGLQVLTQNIPSIVPFRVVV